MTFHSFGFNSFGFFEVTPQAADQALDTGESRVVTFNYRANDGEANSNTGTVTVTINGVNDAPVVANLSDSTNEDTTFTGSVSATDVDDSSFTFSLVGTAPAGVTFNSDGSFSVAPLAADQALDTGDSRVVSFDYLASDGEANSNTGTVNVTIHGVNDAPTVANSIPQQLASETIAFSFQIPPNTFQDIDVGDSLSYSARRSDGGSLPSWLSFDAATRTFHGTPSSSDLGSMTIQVTATDSSDASANESFDLAVISTSLEVTGTSISITDVGEATNDEIELALNGDRLVVTRDGTTTEIPLAGLTTLVIQSGGGDDTLTLNLSAGPLPLNVVFDGGVGGFDSLRVVGFEDSGEVTAYTASYSNRNDGSFQYGNGTTVVSTVTFTGLEPITIEGTPSQVVFNLPSGHDTDVQLLDVGGADGIMRLTGSTFETTNFSITAATSITINANAGNDRITIQSLDAGYTGQLIVHGGAGNDIVTASGSTVATSLHGDAGSDTLMGSLFNDTLCGGLGNDSLNGEAGSDTVAETAMRLTLANALLTGSGRDKLTSVERALLTGTERNNVLDASAFSLGNVTLLGGNGNDTLVGGRFAGAADDDGFNDLLDGGAGTDVARQSSLGNQTLATGPTPETVVASGRGNDLWTSVEGASLLGGNGAETLNASAFSGQVTLGGGGGDDTLIGGSGTNLLNGNAGNDSLTGGNASDLLLGGAGHDSLDGRDGNDLLRGQSGNDTVRGGHDDDRIFGDAGTDLLFGGFGQDQIDGGGQDDVIDGEAGHDTITGGAGNDAIRGGEGDDMLNGGLGNDTLLGSAGSDSLRSGGGSDHLSGGTGDDHFEASGVRITLGEGEDTVVGSNNLIIETFVFDFDQLLI